MITLKQIECDNFNWLEDVNANSSTIESCINNMELQLQSDITAVTSEVGLARDGRENLHAKIKDMDAAIADVKALAEAGVFTAAVFDPAATYVYPDIVVFEGNTWRCMSQTPLTGDTPHVGVEWLNLTNYIENLRAETPVLSGAATAPEGTTYELVITDHIEDGVTSYDVTVQPEFGETPVAAGGRILWKLGNVEGDMQYLIKVVRRRRGQIYSDEAEHLLTVQNIPVKDATIAFADTQEGYPGAGITADGVKFPAHSAGVDNDTQIYSAQMEIVQSGGELPVLAGSTADTLLLGGTVATGDVLITDLGETVVQSVESTQDNSIVDLFGDGSCRSFFPFENSPNDLGPNAANINATGTYTSGKFGNAATFPPAVNDMSVPFNPGGVSISWWTKFTTDHHYSIFATSAGNVGLNWTKNQNNYYSYHFNDSGYRSTFGDLTWMVDDGEFHHVVFTFSTNSTKVYVDGVLYYYNDSYSPPSTSATMTQSSIMAAEPLDSLRLFNRALSVDEVGTLYNGGVFCSVSVFPVLASVPTKVFKKADAALKLGAGATGEYLGPEVELTWKGAGALTPQGAYVYSTQQSGAPQGDPFIIDLDAQQDGSGPFYGVPGSADQWLGTSGTAVPVSGITFVNYQLDNYAPASILVQKSSDGIVWDDVETIAGLVTTASAVNSVTFTPFTAPYRRIKASSAVASGWIVWAARWIGENPSTASSLVFTSSESIKDKIYTTGGLHNNLMVDGQEVVVSGASEVITRLETHNSAKNTVASATQNSIHYFTVVDGPHTLPANARIRTLATIGLSSLKVALGVVRYIDNSSAELVYKTEVQTSPDDTGTVVFDCDYTVPANGVYKLCALIDAGSIRYEPTTDGCFYVNTKYNVGEIASGLISNTARPIIFYSTGVGITTKNVGARRSEWSISSASIDSKMALKFAAPATKLRGAWIKVYSAVPTYGAQVIPALYADNAGEVGAELWSGTVTTLDVNDGILQLDFTGSPELTVGTNYWLAVKHSGSIALAWQTVSGTVAPANTQRRGDTFQNIIDDENTADKRGKLWNVMYFSEGAVETTATLATPLAQAPTGAESVVIPDRCTLTSDEMSAELVDGKVKITSGVIDLPENPDLKRVAMAVDGPAGETFNSGKIYIKEFV
ncbi:LamG domain-containing protein [Maridesulfovibrio sp. FT414]|uniref:LamG domain-containing protein n=1 Tax=Maridesulfovibrio sp. FT414 TaxID=2979469 RepID=UPI003D80A387